MSRFVLLPDMADGVGIYDNTAARIVFGPASWDNATRECLRLNKTELEREMTDRHLTPVEPCCGCRDNAVLYRAALEEIAHTSTEIAVQRIANKALGIMGGGDAS